MAGDIMAAARDNIVVLLREQKELLGLLLDDEELLHSGREDDNARVLDKERARDFVEILEGEADKAGRLEITLAVAGTVKAGKSTAINAIIGTEALPNRARPMTALPTVIRHQPNRFEPCLTVNNAAALDDLAKEIAGKLRDKECLAAVRTAHDVDMGALINDLANGGHAAIGARHEGRERVFEALGRINDLLRLGRHEAVGVELAVEEYDDLHEMPSLDVHFRCVADKTEASGSLALLDLPGFNEARLSKHLTGVLKEQLEKASAILVVLDYTQLNTVASGELEVLLAAVSGVTSDRLFVVVNKFDQRTSRDPDEAETKKHISAETMGGIVDHGRVYLVSARHAYLASRALDALDRHGSLPLLENEHWVADFGDLAFRVDGAKLQDPDEVRKWAEGLWDVSGFEPLLKDVVAAHDRAAVLSLKSALEKLKTYGDRIENYLNITDRALTAGVQDLEVIIVQVNKNIDTVRKTKEEFTSRQQKLVANIQQSINDNLQEFDGMIDSRFKALFDEEIEKRSKQETRKQKKGLETNLSSSFPCFPNLSPKDQGQIERIRDGFSNEGKLVYYDKKSYQEAIVALRGIYAGIAKSMLSGCFSSIEKKLIDEQRDMNDDLGQILAMISGEVREKMLEAGIEISIILPEVVLDKKAVKPASVEFSSHVKSQIVTRTRISSSFWHSVDIFDTGWAEEEYDKKQTYYEIRLDKTVIELRRAISVILTQFQKSVETKMLIWREKCDEKVNNLGAILDEYNQSLMDGRTKSRTDKERLDRVVANIRRMKKKSKDSRANVREFEGATRNLLEIG